MLCGGCLGGCRAGAKSGQGTNPAHGELVEPPNGLYGRGGFVTRPGVQRQRRSTSRKCRKRGMPLLNIPAPEEGRFINPPLPGCWYSQRMLVFLTRSFSGERRGGSRTAPTLGYGIPVSRHILAVDRRAGYKPAPTRMLVRSTDVGMDVGIPQPNVGAVRDLIPNS